jgi:hypothetical protein
MELSLLPEMYVRETKCFPLLWLQQGYKMPYWQVVRRLSETVVIHITGCSVFFFQDGGPNSNILIELSVQVLRDDECGFTYFPGSIKERFFCAIDYMSGKGPCTVSGS